MIRKIIIFTSFLLFVLGTVAAQTINKVEPLFWWAGMRNPELQLMVYGDHISEYHPVINEPGVYLKSCVTVDSPNYLILYLDLSQAHSGTFDITFVNGEKKFVYAYELKERKESTDDIQGYDSSDVLYLIMPDRFANGDQSNDQISMSTEYVMDRSKPGARHGGDLKGIEDHLDYFVDLGVTAIWLNPVLENDGKGGSYHGYFSTDMFHVDRRLGSNEDYLRLINKAHQKGLRVVMDMIFNHCGSSHWWLKDFPSSDWLNNQDNFVQTNHFKWTLMDVHAPQSEREILVNGWFGRGMPDLNQKNRHLARYLIQNSIWWIEYSRIDGIRQDTHPYADYDFMATWCKEVENEYPDFNIVGEAWYPRGTASAWWQRDSKMNESNSNLKTVMDFDLTFTCQKAFGDACSSREGFEAGLFKIYEVIAQDFLFPDPNNVLVFLDNHDLGRFMQKGESDLRRYKQAIAFLLTTRGIPQIYYGTEILMSGTKAEGDGIIRTDFPGGWAGDPKDAFTREGRTDLQNQAWDYMRKLLNWRQRCDAVKEGKLIHYTPDKSGCYVYARVKDNKTVLVLMNGTDQNQTLDMNRFHEVVKDYRSGKDIITDTIVAIDTAVHIPARGVYILELV